MMHILVRKQTIINRLNSNVMSFSCESEILVTAFSDAYNVSSFLLELQICEVSLKEIGAMNAVHPLLGGVVKVGGVNRRRFDLATPRISQLARRATDHNK